MKKIIGIVIGSLFSFQLYSQPPELPAGAAVSGALKGKIVEAGSNVPLEYANVAVYSLEDSTLAGGGIANANGEFEVKDLKMGKYYLDAKFIGYEHTKIAKINVTPRQNKVELGVILLKPASENLAEVNVTAQNAPIMYEIDKKIIDPSQFPTSANGTATDVLANTPSVVVDIEGNVTLRGSSSFTVLIDGRPTPFDAADALDQIPASTIRNIEIITNPSAKYDPDGNAGIININTKKSKLTGVSGMVNASADSYGSITGDFLFNYKLDKFNVFLSGNKSNRYGRGFAEDSTVTFGMDTIYRVSSGQNERGHDSWSVKTGFDYFINDLNTLTFNLSLNGRERLRGGTNNFHEYSNNGYDLTSLTESSSGGNGKNLALSLDYKKKFKKEGEELTAYVNYEKGNDEELSYYDQFDGSDALIQGQKNWENGNDNEFRFQLDYVYPFTTKMKLEAGLQTRIDRSFEWNDVHWYAVADTYVPGASSPYYTESNFSRDIHSAYTTFSNAGAVFGYQLGLRTEYTDRSIDYSGSTEEYKINRWDFFPTAHFSFNLPMEQQLMASYSRRIERPRGYYLEPFKTYEDAYNIRQGNPSIEPEYIDSYETGYQKTMGKGFLSAELYHRITNNKIERIRSVYQDNVMLQTIENIGKDYSTGVELMWNARPTKWWMFNVMGNIYRYKVEGILYDNDVSQTSNNWNARWGNTFTLSKTTKLQIDGMYNSPTISAQGRREGFAFTNVAVRQDFFDNKLNVTLSVRDVLNTAKFGFESSGSDFYSKRSFDMKSPVFAMTLSYKINNYRQKKGAVGGGGEGMDMNGGGDF
ncbi:MAG: TonB-dependent receptor domain-containing protein [Prolixibacteraceae bacterium]